MQFKIYPRKKNYSFIFKIVQDINTKFSGKWEKYLGRVLVAK